jgi:hypothetical protein
MSLPEWPYLASNVRLGEDNLCLLQRGNSVFDIRMMSTSSCRASAASERQLGLISDRFYRSFGRVSVGCWACGVLPGIQPKANEQYCSFEMRVRPQAVPFEMDRPNLHAGSKRDRALLTRFRLLCPLELAGEFIRPGQGRLISEGRHQHRGPGGVGRRERKFQSIARQRRHFLLLSGYFEGGLPPPCRRRRSLVCGYGAPL